MTPAPMDTTFEPTFKNSQDASSHHVANKSISFAHAPLPSKFEYSSQDHIGSSYDAFVADGDERKEFLLKKKDDIFNYLTGQILREQQQHKVRRRRKKCVSILLCLHCFLPFIKISHKKSNNHIIILSSFVPAPTSHLIILYTACRNSLTCSSR